MESTKSAKGEEKIRVVLGKLGVDKHIRGTRVVVQGLRDAGMEVIYLGWCLTPEMVVQASLDEDADVIGLSTHDNFHRALFPKVVNLLKERGASHICVVAGGIIPDKDKPFLESLGITGNFGSEATMSQIAEHIRQVARERRLKEV